MKTKLVAELKSAFNQAKNTSLGLVDQAPAELKSAFNQAKNTSLGLVDQAPAELKSAFNQAKNTSLGLVDQAPAELKSAFNQAKNFIKNDTNSSKLVNLLEGDVGNLINEFSNFLSK